jgi:hypothetical protein
MCGRPANVLQRRLHSLARRRFLRQLLLCPAQPAIDGLGARVNRSIAGAFLAGEYPRRLPEERGSERKPGAPWHSAIIVADATNSQDRRFTV